MEGGSLAVEASRDAGRAPSPFSGDQNGKPPEPLDPSPPASPPAAAAGGWRGRPGWRGAVAKLWRPVNPDTKIDVAFVMLAAVTYGVLFFSMGSAFLPGHAAWATLLLWVSSQIGGFIAWQLRLPRVIGMLCAGLAMRNIPWSATSAFPPKWGVQMRAGALATIFLRCGLELDFGTMRRFKYPAMRLALLPGLAEAFYDGGLAVAIFGMPVLLGFTMGFILKAVGPGLVVPAMFQLQKTGLGRDQGIPSTVVISASFDDVIAITGYSIFSSVAITGQGNVAWQIASGPTQVAFGILGGLLAGVILGCTRLFSTRNKRLVGIYGSALLLMYFLEYYNLLSGGALGALFVGLVASNAWEKGFPRFGSLGRSLIFSPEIERVVAVFWNWIWEPMLFVTIGWSINFDTLDKGIIPNSLIIICSGLAVRLLVTLVSMSGFGYTWREKVFYALAWTPKATVQAALSASPLALINKYKKGEPDYEEWVKWGNDILVTGIFAIIVCGTLGTTAIHLAAPHLLLPAEESGSESEAGGGGGGAKEGEGEEGEMVGAGETFDTFYSAQEVAITAAAAPQEPASRSRSGGVRRGLAGSAPRLGSGGMASTDGDGGAGLGASGGGQYRRPASAGGHVSELEAAPLSDHELLAEYLDAIRSLTAAVHNERTTRLDLMRLSDRVLATQQRLEAEMGQREPSVRELFRTASRLASTFILRPPSGHQHQHQHHASHHPPGTTAGSGLGLPRHHSGSSVGAMRARSRSMDQGTPPLGAGRGGGAPGGPGGSAHGGSVHSSGQWPDAERPPSPHDMA